MATYTAPAAPASLKPTPQLIRSLIDRNRAQLEIGADSATEARLLEELERFEAALQGDA